MIFSERDLAQLNDRFNSRYHDRRGDRSFTINAKCYDDKVWMQTLLRNNSDTFHYAVETYTSKNKHPRAQAFFLLAYMDAYWDEYFSEDEGVYLPIDWTEHCYQEEKFFIKGQVLNLKAEKLANDLLGE